MSGNFLVKARCTDSTHLAVVTEWETILEYNIPKVDVCMW